MIATISKRNGYSDQHGELSGFSIECADNGFTVTVSHKIKPTKDNMMQSWDSNPDKKVFNSVDDMVTFIKATVSGAAKSAKAAKSKPKK